MSERCKHIMTRIPKEHQENKCRICGKPYKKSKQEITKL